MSGQGGEVQTCSRDGLVFDVRDSGAPDGDVVVCLHGFPQSSAAWDAVTPALVSAGLRVLAPDQRGSSPGARPQARAAYVLDELVADVLALLDAAGAHAAHVVGHDWGGVVAWALAAAHPRRVRSATVLSTPHPAALREARPGVQSLRSAYALAFQVPKLPERVLLARSGALLRRSLLRSGLPEGFAEEYVRRVREPGALRAALGWYRAVPLQHGVVGPVDVPVTFLHGRRDPFFAAAAVHGTRPHVRGDFEQVELDAGHWLPEREPDAVAEAVLEAVRHSA